MSTTVPGTDILFIFWSLLDAIFTYIDLGFKGIFSAIPETAVIFLEGIICYSVLAFLIWLIERTPASRERLGYKVCYYTFFLFMLMFTFWRLGIIVLAEGRTQYESLSILLMNIFYMVFAILIIFAFLKKISWLKKAILIFTWMMFIIFTWIICPALGEAELSFDMLVQFLTIVVIFSIPSIFVEYQRAKKSGV